MKFEAIEVSVAHGIATLTMNRPGQLNALSRQLLDEMRVALEVVAKDDEVRALLLTGAGRGFCAGADLRDLEEYLGEPGTSRRAESSGDLIAAMMYAFHNRVINALWDFPKPVVTAVNGVAAGGGLGLALSADIVVAARSARFVCVFANQLGIAPDMGTSYQLQRLVGRARAMRMAFLGESVSAEQALDWGLVSQLSEDGALLEDAMSVCRKLALKSPRVFSLTRQAIAKAEAASMTEQLGREAEMQRELCSGPEFQAGLDRFLNKR